jgi:hypothetical protein
MEHGTLDAITKYNTSYKYINHLQEKTNKEKWTELEYFKNTNIIYQVLIDIFGCYPKKIPPMLLNDNLLRYYMGLIDSNHIVQFKSIFIKLSTYMPIYIPRPLYLSVLHINDIKTILQMVICSPKKTIFV